MPEFIRVKFKDSGTVQTIAKPSAVDEDAYTVLDQDATDHNGRPLDPEFPKSKSGQKAATDKESN